MSIEALEARILESGADEDYAVLGDLLEQQGDPRGKLIALQRAGRDEESRAYLVEHPELAPPPPIPAWWHNGYWSEITFGHDPIDLPALLAHPSARFLRKLHIARPGYASERYLAQLERSPGAIIDRPALEGLAQLMLGQGWLPALAELQRLRLGIRTLRVDDYPINGHEADLGSLRGLTELHVRTSRMFPQLITHDSFRALTRLAESLVRLTVERCESFDDEVCAILSALERLEVLHLPRTPVSASGCALLEERLPRLRITR
jgi:hypothetical protein